MPVALEARYRAVMDDEASPPRAGLTGAAGVALAALAVALVLLVVLLSDDAPYGFGDATPCADAAERLGEDPEVVCPPSLPRVSQGG